MGSLVKLLLFLIFSLFFISSILGETEMKNNSIKNPSQILKNIKDVNLSNNDEY